MSDVLSYRESDDSVLVTWSLPDLPTALHKAGLAGVLCYVTNMPAFAPQVSVPLVETTTSLELRVRFTERSLRALMDSVYSGEKHLVESSSKWKSGNLKEERSAPAHQGHDKRPAKIWIYEIDRPKADLMVYWRHGDPEDRWVALWRDALRGVLRESRSGEIYDYTTKRRSPTQCAGDLKGLWKGLVSSARKRHTLSSAVPTSMFIGAEKKNAERVDFKGEVHHNLLLHFWPFVSPVFVPRLLHREQGQWKLDTRKSGYVIAVPEVGNLTEFHEMIESYWRGKQAPSGDNRWRPRDCEVDVAVEGGMAFLHALTMNRLQDMDDGDFFEAVPQVDLYHLERSGNIVRILVADSVRPPVRALRRYQKVVESRRNVLFRRLLMSNVLDGLPWHARAADMLFMRYPVELFVTSEKSPPFARSFGQAAKERFLGERRGMDEKLNLAGKVFDIVGEFVARRAEKRSDVTREQFPRTEHGTIDWKKPTQDLTRYREARGKVATDAFLAIRGRNVDEFVDYFVGSICAVPQFMGAKGVGPRDGYIAVANALHESEDKRVEMKNLTMLALSAHGWSNRPESSDSSDTHDTHSNAGGTE